MTGFEVCVYSYSLVGSDELLREIWEGRDLSTVTSLVWDPMIDFVVGNTKKRDVKGEDTRMIETSLSFKEINFDPWIFVQSSWQLVFWPPTGKCYQIFSQGPCPPTQVWIDSHISF